MEFGRSAGVGRGETALSKLSRCEVDILMGAMMQDC